MGSLNFTIDFNSDEVWFIGSCSLGFVSRRYLSFRSFVVLSSTRVAMINLKTVLVRGVRMGGEAHFRLLHEDPLAPGAFARRGFPSPPNQLVFAASQLTVYV